MAKVKTYNQHGAETGTLELDDSIFGIEANEHCVHMAVVSYLANQRQGTHSNKTRAEVRGGGRKPFSQKGGGRARQGSIRSPQWTGGGVVFAKKPRDFSLRINKKVRRLALKSVLSDKVRNENLIVLDELSLPELKTKEVVKVMGNLKLEKALVVTSDVDRMLVTSAKNLQNVKVATVNTINVYDILKYDSFVVTKAAVEKMQEVYA